MAETDWLFIGNFTAKCLNCNSMLFHSMTIISNNHVLKCYALRNFMIGICCLTSHWVFSQKLSSVGIQLQGRQFGFDVGIWGISGKKSGEMQPRFWSNSRFWGGFSLGVLRDPGEIMVVNDRLPGSKPFKINKISHSWMLQPQAGYLFVVSERKSRSDLGFRIKTGVSLPVAYSWPVHIWFYKPNFLSDGYIDVEYDPSIHPVNQIGGTSSWVNGVKDGSWTPGIGGQMAMEFEWGNYRYITNSFSIGVNASAFIKKIPNWYDVSLNKQFFPSVFATFAVGINTQKQAQQH